MATFISLREDTIRVADPLVRVERLLRVADANRYSTITLSLVEDSFGRKLEPQPIILNINALICATEEVS